MGTRPIGSTLSSAYTVERTLILDGLRHWAIVLFSNEGDEVLRMISTAESDLEAIPSRPLKSTLPGFRRPPTFKVTV